jgi:hypothetical protein
LVVLLDRLLDMANWVPQPVASWDIMKQTSLMTPKLLHRHPTSPVNKWSAEGSNAPELEVRPFEFARNKTVKDFANTSFSPDTIAILQSAMEAAVATLPDPVSSSTVQSIAQTILRSAKEGERDPVALQRLALLELQITPRP